MGQGHCDFGDHLPSKQMINILHIILHVSLHDIYYCHFIMLAYARLNGLHGTQTQSSLFVITASGCSLCSRLCKCKELIFCLGNNVQKGVID